MKVFSFLPPKAGLPTLNVPQRDNNVASPGRLASSPQRARAYLAKLEMGPETCVRGLQPGVCVPAIAQQSIGRLERLSQSALDILDSFDALHQRAKEFVAAETDLDTRMDLLIEADEHIENAGVALCAFKGLATERDLGASELLDELESLHLSFGAHFGGLTAALLPNVPMPTTPQTLSQTLAQLRARAKGLRGSDVL